MRKKSQEETQDCQKSISSRPEALWTTFRCYKNSKSQTFETFVLLIVTLPLSIFFLLLFARKANLVCSLFIVSQMCFNKNDFLLLNNGFFSIFWVARQSSHSYYLTVRRRSSWIVSPHPHGSFKYSVGMEGFDKVNRRKLMW